MTTTHTASRSFGFILLLAVAGCGSQSLTTSDGGGAARDGGRGDTPIDTGGAAGAGAAGTGGAGGETGGACETNDDCVFVDQCCGGICLAKTDPAPAPTF